MLYTMTISEKVNIEPKDYSFSFLNQKTSAHEQRQIKFKTDLCIDKCHFYKSKQKFIWARKVLIITMYLTLKLKILNLLFNPSTCSNRGKKHKVSNSQESSPTPQFKSINSLALSFLYSPAFTSIHDHWKNHSFVGKVMFLLFNMLSRLVTAFLLRSKRLLISWTLCHDLNFLNVEF